MKTNLLIETQKPEQLELLLRVAQEMGIHVLLLNDAHEKLSDEEENELWKKLTRSQMARDWQEKENDQWDSFIASKLTT